MIIKDGNSKAKVTMQVWNRDSQGYGPCWAEDFFEAGALHYDPVDGSYVVEDIEYCIAQAKDWANAEGDYRNFADWEDPDDRLAFVEEMAFPEV